MGEDELQKGLYPCQICKNRLKNKHKSLQTKSQHTTHINKTPDRVWRNTTGSLVELRVNIFPIRWQILAKHCSDLYLLIWSFIQHRFQNPLQLAVVLIFYILEFRYPESQKQLKKKIGRTTLKHPGKEGDELKIVFFFF